MPPEMYEGYPGVRGSELNERSVSTVRQSSWWVMSQAGPDGVCTEGTRDVAASSRYAGGGSSGRCRSRGMGKVAAIVIERSRFR